MTSSPALEKRYTAAEYEALEDRRQYELVDGQLVERHVSLFSGETAAWFISELGPFIKANKLGRIFDSEVGMRIHPGIPDHTRRADVGFISYDRSPAADTGYLRVPPEFVVEVVSPGDNSQEVRAKVDEWLEHGVLTVWVAFPGAREIHVYAVGQHPQIYTAEDEITAGDILPGFSSLVAAFFPQR